MKDEEKYKQKREEADNKAKTWVGKSKKDRQKELKDIGEKVYKYDLIKPAKPIHEEYKTIHEEYKKMMPLKPIHEEYKKMMPLKTKEYKKIEPLKTKEYKKIKPKDKNEFKIQNVPYIKKEEKQKITRV